MLRREEEAEPQLPWHFLYFLPDPHQQGSLRPICSSGLSRRCSTGAASSSSSSVYVAWPPFAAAAAVSAEG